MEATPTPPGLLTAEDLAAHFGVTRRQIMDWQRQYQWPSVRVGRTIRWTREQVEQITRKHSVTAAGVKPVDGRTPRSARRSG